VDANRLPKVVANSKSDNGPVLVERFSSLPTTQSTLTQNDINHSFKPIHTLMGGATVPPAHQQYR